MDRAVNRQREPTAAVGLSTHSWGKATKPLVDRSARTVRRTLASRPSSEPCLSSGGGGGGGSGGGGGGDVTIGHGLRRHVRGSDPYPVPSLRPPLSTCTPDVCRAPCQSVVMMLMITSTTKSRGRLLAQLDHDICREAHPIGCLAPSRTRKSLTDLEMPTYRWVESAGLDVCGSIE